MFMLFSGDVCYLIRHRADPSGPSWLRVVPELGIGLKEWTCSTRVSPLFCVEGDVSSPE